MKPQDDARILLPIRHSLFPVVLIPFAHGTPTMKWWSFDLRTAGIDHTDLKKVEYSWFFPSHHGVRLTIMWKFPHAASV